MKIKRYNCVICNRNYASLKYLQRHIKIHSNKRRVIRKEKCKLCGHLSVDLNTHMDMVHMLTCILCSFNAKNEKELEKHKIDNHSGLFRCFTCSREYQNEIDFIKHTHISDINIYKIEDEELKRVLLENFYTFKTHNNIGRIIKVYNVSWRIAPINGPPDWAKFLWTLYKDQKNSFKINLSHSFILRDKDTRVYTYFHSSYSNHLVLDKPKLISNYRDMKLFIDKIKDSDYLASVNNEKPTSRKAVQLIVATTFYVASLKSKTLGLNTSYIPLFLSRNNSLKNFIDKDKRRKRDGLCLFKCLAYHFHLPPERSIKLYKRWAGKKPRKSFKGVQLKDLDSIEHTFKLSINIYSFIDDTFNDLELLKRGSLLYANKINVLYYNEHVMYIRDLDKLARFFLCRKCERFFVNNTNLIKHKQKCTGTDTITIYPGGVYERPMTVIDKLRYYNIPVPDNFYYPFRVTWDIESYLDVNDIPAQTSDKTQYLSTHRLLSIACVSNVPHYTKPIVFIIQDKEEDLIERFLVYLESISNTCYDFLYKQLLKTFKTLEMIDEKQMKVTDHVNVPAQQLKLDLKNYIQTLPVIGFNSGRYDLMVIKNSLVKFLSQHSVVTGKPMFRHIIKKNNSFISLCTEKLNFLDISSYIGRDCNLQKYLTTFKAKQSKGFFPYEYITSIDKLKETKFPPHSAFFSKLKNENISVEDYNNCKRTYKIKGMKTLKDYLKHYMELDTVPFLDAVNNHCKVFEEMNIDMFKVAISSPGLSQYMLFRMMDQKTFFSLVNQKFSYIHDLFRHNIIGGPSLIYLRCALKDKTFIPNSSKLCKKIIGYDCNSLYLWALTKNFMPTGFPTVRRKDNNFRLEHVEPYGKQAREWLEYIAYKYKLKIQHKFNGKERQIGCKKIRVDGFNELHHIIFNFHGCLVHGHKCALTKGYTHCPITGIDLRILNDKTQEVRRYLQGINGVTYTEIYECQWQELKKTDSHIKKFLKETLPPRTSVFQHGPINDQSIKEAITSNSLFGMIKCDIHVPDNLKEKFSIYQPIFKNVDISIDDIGPYMKAYAQKHNLMKSKRKCLIGSYWGKDILLITPLVKWYLDHGIEISNVTMIIEYDPKICFHSFGEKCAQMRRKADQNKDEEIQGAVWKLIACSSYGRTCVRKDRQTSIAFVNDHNIDKFINSPRFQRAKELDTGLYEVESKKRIIRWNMPYQIAFFVYGLAKLRMLQFYYDFINKFINPEDIHLLETDTDSLYFCCSEDSLEKMVKPHLREQFDNESPNFLGRQRCFEHTLDRTTNKELIDNCVSCQYDKRTPGLFKIEFLGDRYVGLCSKTYIVENSEKDKESLVKSKGLSVKRNKFTFDDYLNVLIEKKSGSGFNGGIRTVDNNTYSYIQERSALGYLYIKRIVCEDGIHTLPTHL